MQKIEEIAKSLNLKSEIFQAVIAVAEIAAAGELQLDHVKSHLLVKVVTPWPLSYCY